jgi:hypothetical protein
MTNLYKAVDLQSYTMAGVIIPTTTAIALGEFQIAIGTNHDDDRFGCWVLIHTQGGTNWRLKTSILQVSLELSKGENHEKVAFGYQCHCIIVIFDFSLFTWD